MKKLIGYNFWQPNGSALGFGIEEVSIVKRGRVLGVVVRPVAAHTDSGVVLPADEDARHEDRAFGQLAANRTGAEQTKQQRAN